MGFGPRLFFGPVHMSDLQEMFNASVARFQSMLLPGGAYGINELQLRMYALSRQASEGDVRGPRPQMRKLHACFRHDARARLRGLSREAAMRRYIAEVEDLSSAQSSAKSRCSGLSCMSMQLDPPCAPGITAPRTDCVAMEGHMMPLATNHTETRLAHV